MHISIDQNMKIQLITNISRHMLADHLVCHIRHELPALMFRGKVLRPEP